jgi:zinc-ribbon family
MIIYGSKTKQLAKEILTDKCPNCGTQNSVELYIFQKYAHVFWIPFFPLGKTVVSQCGHCKQVLKLKEMPASLTTASENLKSQTKTPIWTFSGLALVAVLITIVVLNDKKNGEKNAKLILTPQSGDVFEVKTKDNQYTLYKIENIEGDSAFIRISQFETSKLTGLAGLKRKGESAYSADVFAFAKKELTVMFDKGEILDIERK